MATKRLSVKQARLLKKHKYILKKLATSNRGNRRTILKNAPGELFKVLNLVFQLLINKNLNLDDEQHQVLKKHKRMISSTKGLKGAGMKQKLIAQRGGALGTILSTVLPLIGVLVQSLI